MAQGRRVVALACAIAALAASPHVVAQTSREATREVQARVVDVQGEDLVLDVGTSSGVAVGQRVELWRPLVLRHPVTRKTLQERFLIGQLELVQVRPGMSLARALSTERTPEPGDVIILHVAAPQEAPPEPAVPLPGAAPPSPPGGPPPLHAPLPPGGAPSWATPPTPVETPPDDDPRPVAARRREAWTAPRAVTTAIVDEVRHGQTLRIALEIADAQGAVLHVRGPKDPSFVSIPMVPSGGDYFAADVPAAQVEAPRLDWFVEAVGAHGRAVSVLGEASLPKRTEVRAAPAVEVASTTTAEAAIWTDYADYNRLRGNDWAWQTEGELGLRLGDEGVRAVRSGFGVYRGEGGSVEELDVSGLPPRPVGLTYGWLEGEFAPTSFFGILPRVVVGLGDDGVTGGGQLLFRIGNDRETNLLLGGEALGTVGVRGIAQLELATFDRFPILFRTEVTNQPAGADASDDDVAGDAASLGGSDVGARGIAQLGFRVVDDLVVSARGSFQGRTIEHAGPGFGGGVSYSW